MVCIYQSQKSVLTCSDSYLVLPSDQDDIILPTLTFGRVSGVSEAIMRHQDDGGQCRVIKDDLLAKDFMIFFLF